MSKKGEFDVFWAKFPRRVAKADARKAWDQTASARPPILELLQSIERMLEWREKLRAADDFVPSIPYPASWLRGERWADEFDAPEVAADRLIQEARDQWTLVMKARADDDPRGLTDYRTKYAVQQIGWRTFMDMRVNDRQHIGRQFLQLFQSAPAPKPRATVHQFPTREVSNG